jgi:hypothetical protein
MDANSSCSTFKSEAADVFKAFTKRITNDAIYISFVENNSIGVEMLAILKIIFCLKSLEFLRRSTTDGLFYIPSTSENVWMPVRGAYGTVRVRRLR